MNKKIDSRNLGKKNNKQFKDIHFYIQDDENKRIREFMKIYGFKNLGTYFLTASNLLMDMVNISYYSGDNINLEKLSKTCREALLSHTNIANFSEKDVYNLLMEPTKNIKGYLDLIEHSINDYFKKIGMNKESEFKQISKYLHSIGEIQERLSNTLKERFGTYIGKKKRYSVIIIDDNKDYRNLLVERFALLDVEAVGFEEIKRAYVEMNENVPDLILIDINLKGLVNGNEFCRTLMLHDQLKKVPKFLITNMTAPKEELLGNCGAIDVLFKPLDDDTFKQLVKYINQN